MVYQIIYTVLGDNTLAIGVARLGSKTQKIVSGTLKELESIDFGAPLHSLVMDIYNLGHLCPKTP